MTPDRLTRSMHAVLDGTASPEEVRALEAVLADDADAAAEFESWQAMFLALDRLPAAHPPEGLMAAIEKKFSGEGQLSSRESVFVAGHTRTPRFSNGLRTLFRPSRSDTTQGYGHMNANRKIWAGGAIAVVALGVVVLATGYPPKSQDVTGTVVPAERYRAPQSGAEAIKLGDQATTPSIATPTDAAGLQAAKTDAGLAADRMAADRMAADRIAADRIAADRIAADRIAADRIAADRIAADRMAADRMAADKKANLSADRNAAAMSADKKAELAADRMAADKKANLSADRNAAAMSADKKAELAADRMAADKKANLAADRNAAAMSADKSARLTSDRAAAALAAEKAAADKKADRAVTN